jgi:sarcosine oxidase subunit alpha
MRDYLVNWGVSVGDRVVVVTNNDDAYRTALAVHRAGLLVPVIVDARPRPDGDLVREASRRRHPHRGRARHRQGQGPPPRDGRLPCALSGEGSPIEDIACDAVAMSGGWTPPRSISGPIAAAASCGMTPAAMFLPQLGPAPAHPRTAPSS